MNQKIPAVGRVINEKQLIPFVSLIGRESVISLIKKSCSFLRDSGKEVQYNDFLASLIKELELLMSFDLKEVINGTGIIVHTNLGRAPLGKELIKGLMEMSGYNNLEFDLKTGKRGNRQDHLKKQLCLLTGAEDAIVVNNNAAALVLLLATFAKGKEVIVSRGELIEIGDSFRIPDIMEMGGALLKEVGSTNKTKLKDYESAINSETAILFKAHTSNFVISGFTESVTGKAMSAIAKKSSLISVYDLGSGMLTKVKGPNLDGPTVKEAISDGVDLVTFSGDKLLGGPQAGVIVGKAELIKKLARNPLMRALRPGKLTIYSLILAISNYLNPDLLCSKNSVFRSLSLTSSDLEKRASRLLEVITREGVKASVIKSENFVGGGAAPEMKLEGFAVELFPTTSLGTFHKKMMSGDFGISIVALLKEGRLFIDIRAIEDEKLAQVGECVAKVWRES